MCSSATRVWLPNQVPCAIVEDFPVGCCMGRWPLPHPYLTPVLVISCALTCEVTLRSSHLIPSLQVLGKFPVIQHFPFGTILSFEPAEWHSRQTTESLLCSITPVILICIDLVFWFSCFIVQHWNWYTNTHKHTENTDKLWVSMVQSRGSKKHLSMITLASLSDRSR